MKNGREHRVPLSVEALAVLTKVSQGEPVEFVFAGRKKRPLSNMAFLMLLRRMGHDKLTGHGFRSTFRDWAAERTNFQAEIAEAALGHVVGNKVEAAYRRGDFFEKRRRLMEAWAQFATTAPSDAVVVSLREATIQPPQRCGGWMRLSTGTSCPYYFPACFPPIMLLGRNAIATNDLDGRCAWGDRLKPGDIQCPLLGVKRT